MNKKNQSINFVLQLSLCLAITYGTNLDMIDNKRVTDPDPGAYTFMQKANHDVNTDIYDTFLENFDCQGEECYYYVIDMVGYEYPILLLSDDVYKFTNERDVAMGTEIYYPVNNEVALFGFVGSNGTAYPIAADTTGIYTAGGHEVTKYSLDIQNRKLNYTKYITLFDKIGEKVNTLYIAILGDEHKIVSEEDFNKAYHEYRKANIINFKRLR